MKLLTPKILHCIFLGIPINQFYMIKYFQILAILLLPVYFILPTGDSHFTICPFFHLTGVPCPGCGMGRSLVHIFHLHFLEALYYNPFGYLIAVSQCYVISSFFFPSLIEIYIKQQKQFKILQYLFGFSFITYGLIRIWSFASGDLFLSQYYFDFTKTFSFIRWILGKV